MLSLFEPAAATTLLRLRLLGTCSLTVSQCEADLRYDKVRALLALLAMSGGQPLRRERLAGWLWPAPATDVARRNLRHALHVLRAALGPMAASLQADRHVAVLDTAALRVDAIELAAAHAAWCRDDAPAADLSALERAAQSFRGEFLAGVEAEGDEAWEQWLREQREAAAHRCADLWRELARQRLAGGLPREALAAARQLLDLHPLDEQANALCMQALAQSESAGAALAHYQDFSRRLQAEWGTTPGAATQALLEHLRSVVTPAAAPERRPLTVLCLQQHVAADEKPREGGEPAVAFAALLHALRARLPAYAAQLVLPHQGLALLYFGLPASRGDSALSAARLALELGGAAREAGTGMALHSAIATVDGSSDPRDSLGPLANHALRLCAHSEAGQLVASAEARDWLRRDLARHGESIQLAPHPSLPGSMLVTAGPHGRGPLSEAPELALVGRRAELALLLRTMRSAHTAPAQLGLVGEAGLGKTRLALEAVGLARSRRAGRLVWLRCSRETAAEPLAPLRTWIAQMAGIAAADSPARAAARLQRLERRLGTGGALAALCEAAASEGMVAGMSLRPRLLGLRDIAARAARQRLLTVVIDDLQWADAATREATALWLQGTKGRVFTLLLAREPADLPAGVPSVALPRLDACASRELLEHVDPQQELQARELEAGLRLAEGLPIFLVELKRHWTAVQEAQTRLPGSLQELLAARLEVLSAPLRRLAGCAAVLGHEGTLEALGLLVQQSEAQLRPQLARLAEAGLLYPPEQGRFLFRHQMLQHAAVQRLALPDQSALHAHAATRLAGRVAPARLAHHWEQAGNAAQACLAHAAAGQQALREGAQREALHHFSRTLELADSNTDPAIRFAAWNGKGLATTVLEGYSSADAHTCFLAARDLARATGDPVRSLRATWGIWLSSSDRVGYKGGLSEARSLLELAQQLPAGVEHELWLCLAHSALGNNLLWLGRLAEAKRHLVASTELAQLPDVRRRVVSELGEAFDLYSLGFLSWIACREGDPLAAQQYIEQAHAIAKALDNAPSFALVCGLAAIEAQMAGDAPRALLWAQRTMAAAAPHGIELWMAVAMMAETWARVHLGQTQDVQGLAAAVAGVNQAMPSAALRFMVPYLEALHRLGRHAEALAVSDQAMAVVRRCHDRLQLDALWQLRAQCHRALGSDEARAARYTRQATRVRQRLLGPAPVVSMNV